MNAPAPSEISDGFGPKINQPRPSALMVDSIHGGSTEEVTTASLTVQNTFQKTPMFPDGDTPDTRHKKSSPSLKTAATIGTSSAVAAAFLASGSDK